MAIKTLEDKISAIGNPVSMLRNAPLGPYQFPIQSEFTNWRDEQEAWRSSAVLFDQSFHMTDHTIEGPDTKKLLEDVAVNSMANFRKDIAKQVVFCNEEGFYVADAIMFILEEDKVNIVNKPINRDWLQYHIDHGDYDVTSTTDDRALDNKGRRLGYRFEVQGPNAWAILEKMNGGPIEDFKFFRMGYINVVGRKVRALRHGMAGAADDAGRPRLCLAKYSCNAVSLVCIKLWWAIESNPCERAPNCQRIDTILHDVVSNDIVTDPGEGVAKNNNLAIHQLDTSRRAGPARK